MIEPEQCKSLAEVRDGLDALDREIAALLAKRFRFTDAAARIKQRRDQVRDDERIAVVIGQVQARAAALGAPAELIAGVYAKLIEASIEHELERFDAARP